MTNFIKVQTEGKLGTFYTFLLFFYTLFCMLILALFYSFYIVKKCNIKKVVKAKPTEISKEPFLRSIPFFLWASLFIYIYIYIYIYILMGASTDGKLPIRKCIRGSIVRFIVNRMIQRN